MLKNSFTKIDESENIKKLTTSMQKLKEVKKKYKSGEEFAAGYMLTLSDDAAK